MRDANMDIKLSAIKAMENSIEVRFPSLFPHFWTRFAHFWGSPRLFAHDLLTVHHGELSERGGAECDHGGDP
jgi:hypothetical protein